MTTVREKTTPSGMGGPAEFAHRVAELGFRVAELGPAAVENELDVLVELGSRAGVSSVLLAVLADQRESGVARQRAFAKVAAGVLHWIEAGDARPLAGATAA